MKRRVLVLLVLLISISMTSAQKKYKEIYPYIESRNYREAVPYLIEFLREEPDHPSANLQLALIYEQRFTSYHPILKFKAAVKNAENAKIRFLKARLLVDEREIRRNGKKYYTNFARIDDRGKLDVEYNTVRLTIDSAYIKIDNFLRYVPSIYEYFTRSVRYYDKASKSFAELNGKYNSLKELYLLYDADLKTSLKHLKTDYDSAIYNFQAYLKASEDYPVTEYEQTYEIKPVVHYRLDGLTTQNDFLAEKIELWDYGTWVDQVNDMISTEIASLRRQIELNEQKLNETLEILKNPSQAITANIDPYDVDRELILKLRNYDYNSIITPLLLYKSSKQELLYQSMMEYEIAEDTVNAGSIETLLAYYSRMFGLSLKSDSLLLELTSRNTEANRMRYDDFVDVYYHGDDGINKFINSEADYTQGKINEYSRLIRKSLISNIQSFADSSRVISYKRKDVPVFITLSDSLNVPDDDFYTSHIEEAPDSSLYLAGITRYGSKENNTIVFISRISRENEIMWLNTFEINKEKLDTLESDSGNINPAETEEQAPPRVFDNFVGTIELTPEGCAMLMTSRDQHTGKLYNTFKVVSDEGEELQSGIILANAVARKLRYNDQSGSYLAAFKGSSMNENLQNPETLFLKRIDMNGDIIWETDLYLSGDVREVLNINKGYLVVGNYTQIRKLTGNEVINNPEADHLNTYIYKLDPQGQITEQLLIRSENPFYTDKVIKINDSNINLLGFPGKETRPTSVYLNSSDDIIHVITNAQLKVLKSNFEILEN